MQNSHQRSSSLITIINQPLISSREELIKKFISACQNGNLDTVKELIESNIITVNDHLSDNVTGLHWASINNRLTICQYLVSKNAVVDYKGGDLLATPLHWASRNGLVYIVDFLLKSGSDPSLCDSQGFNALHLSIHSSNIMLVIYMLLMTNVDIDSTDPNERTSLHWAAYQGDALSVEALINFGASINRVDSTGFTALHWSLIGANLITLKTLINCDNSSGTCDIFAKTNDGKTAFDIAVDMEHVDQFKRALAECGKDSNGYDIIPPDMFRKNKNLPKVITFLIPYLSMGLILGLFSDKFNVFQTLFFDVIIVVITYFLLKKLVFPSYIHGGKAFLVSPFVSGVFSAAVFWAAVMWLFFIFPSTLDHHIFPNVLFLITLILLAVTFFKTAALNPGKIRKLNLKNVIVEDDIDNHKHQDLLSEKKKSMEEAEELIKNGQFDSIHFCIHTYVRIPLRSKYSEFSKCLVARFDHFCPWVYNDIGLRNHKMFIFFTMLLELSIALFCYLSIKHFDYIVNVSSKYVYSKDGAVKTAKRPPHSPFEQYTPLSEKSCGILPVSLCNGYYGSYPVFALLMFSLFQGCWVLILNLVQFYQISKNLTSQEASLLHMKNRYFYSAPVPLELLTEIENPMSTIIESDRHDSDQITITGLLNDSTSDKAAKVVSSHFSCCYSLLKLIGIIQFVDMFNLNEKVDKNHFDFGIKSNCLEFWFLGNISKSKSSKVRNFFRVPSSGNGETYIGDQLIDYYKVYRYPIRRLSHSEIV